MAETDNGILIADLMKTEHPSLRPDASLAEAAALLAEAETSDCMVVDESGALIGVIDEGDLIRAVLPDLEEIRTAGGSVEDGLAAFVRKGQQLASRPITPYVVTEPITVTPGEHAGVAAVIMIDRRIRRLPVVEDGRLVGTVSRGEVARAVLASGASS